jgi:hypothetical protein
MTNGPPVAATFGTRPRRPFDGASCACFTKRSTRSVAMRAMCCARDGSPEFGLRSMPEASSLQTPSKVPLQRKSTLRWMRRTKTQRHHNFLSR